MRQSPLSQGDMGSQMGVLFTALVFVSPTSNPSSPPLPFPSSPQEANDPNLTNQRTLLSSARMTGSGQAYLQWGHPKSL